MDLIQIGWRRLLQLDRPVPERTEREFAAEVERNYRWNFRVSLLDVVCFWLGMNFAAPTTIIPLFLSKLTLNPFIFGLTAVITQGGWYFPQLFTAGYTERLARKKPVIVNLGFFTERLPTWLWILAALFAPKSPIFAILFFLLAHAWHTVGAGLVAPAWQDLIARCFPVDRRGRFFGLSSSIGTGVGALGAFFSSWLLKTFSFPLNFIYTFGIAALFINLSWGFLTLIREPVQSLPSQVKHDHFWSKWLQIIREDHNFRHYLVARFLMGMGTMGVGFVTVAAIQRWHIADSTVGLYTATLLAGQATGNLVAGILADRFGHKFSLELGLTAISGAFLIAWWAPAPLFYYIVFVGIGFSMGARIVSGIMIAMEFSSPQHRPTYIGLSNTMAGLGAGLAPFIGSWIAGFSYHWLFALTAGINLIALILFHRNVHEPRYQSVM